MSVSGPWPDGIHAAAVITVNLDAESVEHATTPLPLWGRMSHGRYGAQAGTKNLLKVLERHGVRATFFIGAWDALRYPALMEEIAAAGHEIAAHGYLHEDFSTLSAQQQRDILAKSEAVLEQVFGERPRGFRAPDRLMTSETRNILAERGYLYDSSYSDDDVPYAVHVQDVGQLIEIPVHHTCTDRFYYEKHRVPTVVESALLDELDATYAEGGLFNLVLHPRGDYGSGRGARLRAVDSVLRALGEYPRLWVATCREIAEWTAKQLETPTA